MLQHGWTLIANEIREMKGQILQGSPYVRCQEQSGTQRQG
jgi:hypothetical protein